MSSGLFVLGFIRRVSLIQGGGGINQIFFNSLNAMEKPSQMNLTRLRRGLLLEPRIEQITRKQQLPWLNLAAIAALLQIATNSRWHANDREAQPVVPI